MTCVSNTSPIPLETSGLFWKPLRRRLEAWWHQRADRWGERPLDSLNDRELHDLGLHRDWFTPPRQPEIGMTWLDRTGV